MSAEVIRPGLLSTIQDAGRPGHRSVGVGPGGAMDEFAFRVANLLVGNDALVPAIEFFGAGPELEFRQAQLVSVCGSDVQLKVDGAARPAWHPLVVGPGQRLRADALAGVGYLAVHSGWQADRWLGSCSTHLQAGVGGWNGKPLQKDPAAVAGDKNVIDWMHAPQGLYPDKSLPGWSIPASVLNDVYDLQRHILCLPGPEWTVLDTSIRERFVSQVFRCTADSNRMGFRLRSEPLLQEVPLNLVSSPVNRGTVQLLPDGQTIILMADHQTTGGYPRVAALLRSEMPRFNRLLQGSDFYFAWCDMETAWSLWRDREELLQRIRQGCLFRFRQYIYGS